MIPSIIQDRKFSLFLLLILLQLNKSIRIYGEGWKMGRIGDRSKKGNFSRASVFLKACCHLATDFSNNCIFAIIDVDIGVVTIRKLFLCNYAHCLCIYYRFSMICFIFAPLFQNNFVQCNSVGDMKHCNITRTEICFKSL